MQILAEVLHATLSPCVRDDIHYIDMKSDGSMSKVVIRETMRIVMNSTGSDSVRSRLWNEGRSHSCKTDCNLFQNSLNPCIWAYVTNSLSRPHHHKGRIPQWAQESPSSPYIRRENVLKTDGDFFDQSYVEGSKRPWRSLHNCRRCWRCPHMYERAWKTMECGRVV